MARRDDHEASRSKTLPEGRGAFGGFIGPRNLLSLVRATAPWLPAPDAAAPEMRLADLAKGPRGYLSVIAAGAGLAASEEPDEAAWTDYFTLCLAVHFGTVATYVPSDVDTKIRDRLWFRDRDHDELQRQKDVTLAMLEWDAAPVSQRIVTAGKFGPISGHDGERLSVLCGGLLGLLRAGDVKSADHFEAIIDDELSREARTFDSLANQPGRERELLVLASALTHNAGDVDQGLSARKGRRWSRSAYDRFGRLAHERPERYGGAFARASRLYREIMASEGHRHYPLRDVRCLRSHPELLLPTGPFLDDWGRRLATWPGFELPERAEVVTGLVHGVRRVKGQVGYDRALAGFDAAHPAGISSPALTSCLPASVRRALRDHDLRRRISIRQASFESTLAKRTRKLLDGA